MIQQEKIDAHANKVTKLALSFKEQISREVDVAVSDVSLYIVKKLSTVRGIVVQSPENARKILAIEDVLKMSLYSSNYYPTILAFVESFVEQVEDFEEFYNEASRSFPSFSGETFSRLVLTEEDKEVLSNQGAAAVAAFEGSFDQTTNELRQLLARVLGESNIGLLVKDVSGIIRRMSNVEPMAKDQLMVFFRTIGSLVYRRIESTGRVLKYTYVGPSDKKVRGFCSAMLHSGREYTMEEIAHLDNDQVVGVFDNCGGYGCRHWWAMSRVIQ